MFCWIFGQYFYIEIMLLQLILLLSLIWVYFFFLESWTLCDSAYSWYITIYSFDLWSSRQMLLQLSWNWLRKFLVIIVDVFPTMQEDKSLRNSVVIVATCLFYNFFKRAECQALLVTFFKDLLPSLHISVGNSYLRSSQDNSK